MLDFPRVSRDLLIVERNWKDLGRAVAYARKTAGWTQAELSALVEQKTGEAVSSRTIGTLERGEGVNDVTLNRVAVTLGWAPSTPHAILDGLQAVGLAGELIAPGAGAQFGGSGTLTTGVTPLVPVVGRRTGVREPPADTTLQHARETVADHERDFTLAAGHAEDWLQTLQLVLQGHIPSEDPLEILETVSMFLDQMITFDQGRRYWQRQVDLLRRQEGEPGGMAARRGRRDRPDEHAE